MKAPERFGWGCYIPMFYQIFPGRRINIDLEGVGIASSQRQMKRQGVAMVTTPDNGALLVHQRPRIHALPLNVLHLFIIYHDH
jgi:hypothetical protein